jgi:elongation factor Ts
MKPQYIQLSEIPVAIQEKQREIFTEVAQKSDKPADMLEKIIERQLDKHFNELCLLGQAFIKQPKQSVAELLAAKQAEVVQMVRFEVGEGIEVNKKSFEEEVMEQARGSH